MEIEAESRAQGKKKPPEPFDPGGFINDCYF